MDIADMEPKPDGSMPRECDGTFELGDCEHIDVPMPPNSAHVTLYVVKSGIDGYWYCGYDARAVGVKSGVASTWMAPVVKGDFPDRDAWQTRVAAVRSAIAEVRDWAESPTLHVTDVIRKRIVSAINAWWKEWEKEQ